MSKMTYEQSLIEAIADRDKRIAELEKELNLAKDIIVAHQVADETGYIDGVGWVDNWREMEETVATLIESHNLEQQIKSIENLCGRLKHESYFHKETHDMAVIMISELNQAKELKGDSWT